VARKVARHGPGLLLQPILTAVGAVPSANRLSVFGSSHRYGGNHRIPAGRLPIARQSSDAGTGTPLSYMYSFAEFRTGTTRYAHPAERLADPYIVGTVGGPLRCMSLNGNHCIFGRGQCSSLRYRMPIHPSIFYTTPLSLLSASSPFPQDPTALLFTHWGTRRGRPHAPDGGDRTRRHDDRQGFALPRSSIIWVGEPPPDPTVAMLRNSTSQLTFR